MSIVVPQRIAALQAKERLVKGILAAVDEAGEAGLPTSRLRRLAALGVSPDEIQRVENRLVREGILRLEGDVLRLGTLDALRAYLARSKWMDSRVVAVAPEPAPAPLIVPPGGDA
jgi:hypothetical protein